MVHRLHVEPIGQWFVVMVRVVVSYVPYLIANTRNKNGTPISDSEPLALVSV